jgi:hypothetical protein
MIGLVILIAIMYVMTGVLVGIAIAGKDQPNILTIVFWPIAVIILIFYTIGALIKLAKK